MKNSPPKHIAINISELVLPHGTRMPDQLNLRRLVEAELQRRLNVGQATSVTKRQTPRQIEPRDVTQALVQHIDQLPGVPPLDWKLSR